jgi:hypothetical protein
VSLSVAVDEELRSHDAFAIHEERAGVGHTIEVHFAEFFAGHLGVAKRICPDGFALGIGEQRERDFLFLGKCLENVGGIVADPNNFHAGFFNRGEVFLQLNQLLLAERSPTGRAIKHERDSVVLSQIAEGVFFAGLIVQFEFRGFFPHFDSRLAFGSGIGGRRRDCETKQDCKVEPSSHDKLLRFPAPGSPGKNSILTANGLRSRIRGFSMLRVLVFVFGCAITANAPNVLNAEPLRVGDRHADFTLPSIADRKPVSLSDFRGKKILFIQFASW